jgi:hypothetical protein
MIKNKYAGVITSTVNFTEKEFQDANRGACSSSLVSTGENSFPLFLVSFVSKPRFSTSCTFCGWQMMTFFYSLFSLLN